MTHGQIEDEDIIERYARDQLPPEQRQAFEEHFFACGECFEKLQAVERFIAGVRDAAERGLLRSPAGKKAPLPARPAWLPAALVVSFCAAILFAVLAGWLYFFRVPQLNRELSQQAAQQRAQKQEQAALEQRPGAPQAEADVPLVMLQSTRGLEAPPNEVLLPSEAPRLILWIEVPAARYRSFRLRVFTAGNREVATLDRLHRNRYGALAASLPADRLPPGEFRITLTGEEPPPASLVGEYRLRIRRP
jgi:Putative zinc-finger